VVPVHPVPPHCSHGPAQEPLASVVAGVAGAAVVVTGAAVAAAEVEPAAAVVSAPTAELGSQMENQMVCSTHVKPLLQQVLPVQSCPPH